MIRKVRDDLGRDLMFARPPERIVSLVPSDTHSLCALGVGDRVVGRTRYCHDALAAPEVGGTKDVDVERVIELAPDLVIANQEENARPALEQLAARGVRVLVSLPRRVADAVAHLARLARAVGVAEDPAVVELVRRGYALTQGAPPASELAVAVPIWMDPLMTFNAETYGSDVLTWAGATNVFGDRQRLYPLTADLGKGPAIEASGRDVRYPRITREELAARAPEVIALPDEPHPFTDDDAASLAASVPAARVARIDGKDLFWYGAWTIEAVPRIRAWVQAQRR
ncbi:MAG: helical backbone metal receptor [Deltaproteobacteria bacterium]|nr:helical backbone metal receptor [Deltaproteobacteria bacterium]